MKTKKGILYLTEDDCLEMIEKARWKEGVFCPYCKSKEVVKNGEDGLGGIRVERYVCKHCENTLAQMRTKLYQSAEAHIIPPSQRQKSRYQNIGIISAWGMKSLRHLSQKTTK